MEPLSIINLMQGLAMLRERRAAAVDAPAKGAQWSFGPSLGYFHLPVYHFYCSCDETRRVPS